MSKSKSRNERQIDLDKVFEKALESVPIEVRKVIEEEGIKSMEDLFVYGISNGMDPFEVIKKVLSQEEGKNLVNEYDEDFDDDVYSNDEFDEETDDYEYGFERLPSGLLIDTESKEYHIRIKLNDAPVNIWRELLVPSNISLELLAKMLLVAMDWEDRHLYQFTKNGVYFSNIKEMDDDMMPFGSRNDFLDKDSNTVALSHVLHEKGDRMKFEYDFGDSWMHDVWLKGIREYSPGESPCVKLLKGKGACPPEDCGGVWGYEDLLEIFKKKRKTSEEKERLEWYCIDKYFDPEEFDLEEIQLFIEELWNDVLREIEARKNNPQK